MIGLLGYNFLADGNAADPYPTNVSSITSTKIQNGIYHDLFLTKDVESAYSTTVPTVWDFNTILLANFNGTLSAGNIGETLQNLDSIRVKRRPKGEFEWITLKEYKITSAGDISFSFVDSLGKNNTIYEYAWVPVMQNGTEGSYAITEVLSKFNGVYICDLDNIYKCLADVSYGETSRVQQIGVFEPYGRKYPVYVANGMQNYETGSMSNRIVGSYLSTSVWDRQEMVGERELLFDFLTNKKAKIIKDYNGNFWLVVIVDNPTVSYDPNYGNGIMMSNFSWSEVGDANSADDMKSAGLSL